MSSQSVDFEISSARVIDAWHTQLLAGASIVLLMALALSIGVALGRRIRNEWRAVPRTAKWLHVVASLVALAYSTSAAIARVVTARATLAVAESMRADGYSTVRSALNARLYSQLGLAVAVLVFVIVSVVAWRSVARRAPGAIHSE